MQTKSQFLLVILLLVGLSPGISAQQTAAIVKTVEAGQVEVVRLEQTGQDILVRVTSGEVIDEINNPVGSHGPEIFLLSATGESEPVTFHIDLIAESGPSEEMELIGQPLSRNSPALLAYTRFHEAGRLAASESREATLDSAESYRLAAENFANASLPELSNFSYFLAASRYFAAFDLENTRAALAAIPRDACAVSTFCYKSVWLNTEVSFLSDQFFDAALGYQEAIREASLVAEDFDIRADLALMYADMGLSVMMARMRQSEAQKRVLDERFPSTAIDSYLQTALDYGNQLDDAFLIGRAYSRIAAYYHHIEKDDVTSVDYLNAAIDYLQQADDRDLLISTYSNLAITYRGLGEYGLAQDAIHSALEFIEASVDASHARESYNQLAELYLMLGDYDRAERFARQTIALDEDSGRGRKFSAMNTLGKILRETDRVEDAMALHEQSLAYYEAAKHLSGTANLLYQLGLDHLQANNLAQSRRLLSGVATVNRAGEELSVQPEYIRDWGRLLIAEGEYSEALEFLHEAESRLAQDERVYAGSIELAQMLMLTYQYLGDFESAVSYGEKSIELISNVRGKLEFYRLGPAWSSRTTGVVEQYAEILLERYYLSGKADFAEQALLALEKVRAANFLQQRAASQESSGLERSINPEEQRLRRQLTVLSRSRAQLDIDSEEYEETNIEYFRTLERYEALLEDIDSGDAGGSLSDVSQLVARLPRNTAAIEYLCVEGSYCHGIVLSDEGIHAKRLGEFDEIEIVVAAANAELRNPRLQTTGSGIERLGGQVLAGLLPQRKQQLVFVTDYPLSSVPLSVLNTGLEVETYAPLYRHFSHAYTPSLAALEPVSVVSGWSYELAVLADPMFSSLPASNSGTSEQYRGWVEDLPRLPWTAREAENLSQIFADKPISVHSGINANRENLMSEETRSSRIVHIASHAFFDQAKSDLVGIALSPERTADSNEGDFVTLGELMNIGFSAELLVISGCETGQGEYLNGEGAMSLARGFLAQGVNEVISTLWPVSDRASAEFMKLFYEALHIQGLPASEALRSAQIQLSENPSYRAPFYWAAYVLTSAVSSVGEPDQVR